MDEIPILGKAKHKIGDLVKFNWSGCEWCGLIEIVDEYGTFEQQGEPSYDIYVAEDNCLYKHIRESKIFDNVSLL